MLFRSPVRCLPQSIPVKLQYDISEMDIGDIARVKDLELEEGVEVLLDGQQGIVSVISGKALDAQLEALDTVEGEEVAEGEEGAEGEAAAEGEGESESSETPES